MVSGGGVKVPNEIGQSLQVAQGTLQGDGLNYTVSHVPATGGTTPGTVVGMQPGPGTRGPEGHLDHPPGGEAAADDSAADQPADLAADQPADLAADEQPAHLTAGS